MARKDSTLDHLHDDPAENRTRQEALFERIRKDGVQAPVAWLKETYGVVSSMQAVSRFKRKWEAKLADEEMLDRLAARANRARTLGSAVREGAPGMSPETIQALDQHIYEIVAIDPEDPRLDRLVKIAKTLTDSQDRTAQTALAVAKFRFDAVKAVLANADLVRELASSAISDDEKTSRLGQAIFGEEWK